MIKTVAVDTNVLLDFLFKRKPGYEKSLHLINECRIKKVQIFITGIVFPELEWVLRSFYKRSLKGNFQDELSRFPYKQSKELILEFIDELISLEGILTEDKVSLQQALNVFRQSNIKFTDSIILTQVQNFKSDEFLTFDENLKKIYQEQL